MQIADNLNKNIPIVKLLRSSGSGIIDIEKHGINIWTSTPNVSLKNDNPIFVDGENVLSDSDVCISAAQDRESSLTTNPNKATSNNTCTSNRNASISLLEGCEIQLKETASLNDTTSLNYTVLQPVSPEQTSVVHNDCNKGGTYSISDPMSASNDVRPISTNIFAPVSQKCRIVKDETFSLNDTVPSEYLSSPRVSPGDSLDVHEDDKHDGASASSNRKPLSADVRPISPHVSMPALQGREILPDEVSRFNDTTSLNYTVLQPVSPEQTSVVHNDDSDLLPNKSCSMSSVYAGTRSLSPADNFFMNDDTDSKDETDDDDDETFHLSYCSSSSSDESMSDDDPETANTNNNANGGNTCNVSNSLNATTVGVCDSIRMHVENSENNKKKRSMCVYCKKLQTQLPRHLEMKHKNEEEVKKFRNLPKGVIERKKIIELIRRRGNFIYNMDASINQGDLLVCRRPAQQLQRRATDFVACVNCKGFFSKNNVRHHFQVCSNKTNIKNERNVQVLGRAVACRIHYTAKFILRKKIFPVLREDEITKLIRYDELLIAFANKMSCKYRLEHQHDMIRARLRLLGRFIATLKQMDSDITEFACIYNPKKFDVCIKAVHSLAQFDETSGTCKTPSIATSLGTLIKQIGQILRSTHIKRQDVTRQSEVENFLKLLEEDYPVSVNKTVYETQALRKRQKNVTLPSIDDIRKLNIYLKDERNNSHKSLLENGYSITVWRTLAETTLTSIQVFNRRRAGELERMLIDDLKSCQKMSEETSEEYSKSLAKYVRIVIRGKLGRTVPVLLHEDVLESIELILKYRENAGVPSINPYIFGISSNNPQRYKYLRACILMRKFSAASGAKVPLSLRGTVLRKHVATVCVQLDISENKVSDLANFMGHDEKIHKSHYRQSVISRDLAISQLLKHAQGDISSEDDEEKDESSALMVTSETTANTHDSASDDEAVTTSMEPSHEGNSQETDTDSSDIETRSRKKSKVSLSARNRHSSKVRWTNEERSTALNVFGDNIHKRTLPSFSIINHIKEKHPVLRNRTNAQIKTWVHNQIRKSKGKDN